MGKADFPYQVLLCSHRGEAFLEAQVRSILAQEPGPQSLEIHDDASDDSTREILARLEAEDERVHVRLFPAPARGPARAFLEGLESCSSPWVFLSDQDDLWPPGKAARFAEVVADRDPDGPPLLVHSDARGIDVQGKELFPSRMRWDGQDPSIHGGFPSIAFQNCVQGAASLVNRGLLEVLEPSPDAAMHDWWLALGAATFGEVLYLDEPWLEYRQHSSNQIGSQGWGWARALSLARQPALLRSRAEAMRRQLKSFEALHRDRIPAAKRAFFEDLRLTLAGDLFWGRFLCNHGVRRSSFSRQIGLFLF